MNVQSSTCWQRFTTWCCSCRKKRLVHFSPAKRIDIFERAIEARQINDVKIDMKKHNIQKSTDILNMHQFLEDTKDENYGKNRNG
jgi:hypothetical protein